MRTLRFEVSVLTDFQGGRIKDRHKKMQEIQNAINIALQQHSDETGSAQVVNARCPRVEDTEGIPDGI